MDELRSTEVCQIIWKLYLDSARRVPNACPATAEGLLYMLRGVHQRNENCYAYGSPFVVRALCVDRVPHGLYLQLLKYAKQEF